MLYGNVDIILRSVTIEPASVNCTGIDHCVSYV